jgi:multimeric flavodoxin WrbA
MKKRLLIVYHSATGGTRRMLDAVIAGACDPLVSEVEVRVRAALVAGVDDVLDAHGLLLGTPENFGYMSGALKDFFDRTYNPCLSRTQGLPYGVFVRAGNDGSGALQAIARIATGLRWRAVAPPVVWRGEHPADALEACTELGQTLAAGLEAGVF